MSRDGSGTYNLPAQAVVPANSLTSSTNFNATINDIASALTQSVSKDGQTVPTGNMPMGTYRHTNVGAAQSITDYAQAGQVQDGAFVWGGTASNTTDEMEVDMTPAIAAYAAGQRFAFLAPAEPNTGPVLLDVNSLGQKSVYSHNGYDLAPGDIGPSSLVHVVYDGAAFRLAAPLPARPNLIVNGAMTISQRVGTTATTPTTSGLTLDRWLLSIAAASKITYQQVTSVVPAGASHSLKLSVAAGYSAGSSEAFVIQQNIEGINVAHLGWGAAGAKALAISFLVRASATGTYNLSVTNSAGTRSYVTEFDIDSADTWTRIELVIPGDTTGTWLTAEGVIGAAIRIDLGSHSGFEGTADTWAAANYTRTSGAVAWVATTSRTLYVADVKAEIASPTAFERESATIALARCQRYYQVALARWDGQATSGVSFSHTYPLPVRMAKTPTLTFSGEAVTSFASGNPTTTLTTRDALWFSKAANATAAGLFSYVVAADAEI